MRPGPIPLRELSALNLDKDSTVIDCSVPFVLELLGCYGTDYIWKYSSERMYIVIYNEAKDFEYMFLKLCQYSKSILLL